MIDALNVKKFGDDIVISGAFVGTIEELYKLIAEKTDNTKKQST